MSDKLSSSTPHYDAWKLYCEAWRECFPTSALAETLSVAALGVFAMKLEALLAQAPRSESGEHEGYPGIAHDFEQMRKALVMIRDECFSGNAYDIAVETLNAIGRIEGEASPSATPRKGWAIRNTDGRWRTMDTLGMPDYTDDEAKALVCRLREHVDAYAADDPDDVRIVEVAW